MMKMLLLDTYCISGERGRIGIASIIAAVLKVIKHVCLEEIK
jgi:hypothetical protein